MDAAASRGRPFRGQRILIYYDGWCTLCRQSAARLKRLDWLDLLEFVSFRDPGVIEREGLNAGRLQRRMQSRRARGGPIHEGIDAVIQIAWRVPLLWLAAPVLLVARWTGVGQPAYDFIAARRHGGRDTGDPRR